MSTDQKVGSRPTPTPRVVDALQQYAFDKKDRENMPPPDWSHLRGLLGEELTKEPLPQEAPKKKLSLTEAKNLVAVEFGFENWQHFKRLSREYESIAKKRAVDLRQDFVFKTALELYLDSADVDFGDDETEDDDDAFDTRISLDDLVKHIDVNGPPTEAVCFEIILTLESKADRSQNKIGELTGAIHFDNEKNSLFLSFDAESADLGSFAEDFESSFDEEEREDIFDLAYVNSVYVAEEYDEGEFLKLMIEGLYQYLESHIDAVYVDPAPRTIIQKSEGRKEFWDRSKERKQLIIETLHASKFEIVGKGPYLVRRTWR